MIPCQLISEYRQFCHESGQTETLKQTYCAHSHMCTHISTKLRPLKVKVLIVLTLNAPLKLHLGDPVISACNGEPSGSPGGADTQLGSVTYSRSSWVRTLFNYVSVHLGGLSPELMHPSWGSSTHSALTRMGSKLQTDAVLNDETSEIERDLCAFGPIEGRAPATT